MMKNVSACNMTATVSRQRQLMMSFLNWSWRKVSTMNSNELIYFLRFFFMFSTRSTNFTLLLARVYWCNNFNHQMLTAWKNVRSIIFHNRSQHDYEIVCSIAAQFLNFLICSTHSESWSFFSSHRKSARIGSIFGHLICFAALQRLVTHLEKRETEKILRKFILIKLHYSPRLIPISFSDLFISFFIPYYAIATASLDRVRTRELRVHDST